MLPGGQPFEHWTYRLIGDAGLNTASMTLLSRLLAQGQLAQPRARLDRPGGRPGLRQALFLDFGGPLSLAGQSGAYLGLWLVEQADRKVFCHGIERPSGRSSIGGRMLNDLAVMDPDAAWVDALAEALSAQILVAPSASRATPDRPSARWLLTQVERTLLRAALADFRAALDPEVLAVMRHEGHATPAIFNAYGGAGSLERRNRLQAARAFPWFADVLRDDWRLRRAVTQGEPLLPALAARFQVTPGTITQTRALTPPPATPAARLTQLKRLDALPPAYRPQDTLDWAESLTLSARLHDLAEVLGVEPSHLLKPFRAGWPTGLTTLAHQSGAPLDVDAIFEMMQAAYGYGVRPVLLAWQDAGRLPAGELPRQAPACFFPRWFGRYGLGRLATLSQRWHQALARFSLARLETDPDARAPLSWPALLPVVVHTHGPYRLLELTSQRALEQEGHRLGHCVGTYVATCLDEGGCIYSVRDRRGQSCSTFQVQLTPAGPLLIQHKALANVAPVPAEQAVVARFLERVLAPVPLARVAAVRAARQTIAAEAVELIERLAWLEENGELMGEVEAERVEELMRLTDVLHPPEARRAGIPAFLLAQGTSWWNALGLAAPQPAAQALRCAA